MAAVAMAKEAAALAVLSGLAGVVWAVLTLVS